MSGYRTVSHGLLILLAVFTASCGMLTANAQQVVKSHRTPLEVTMVSSLDATTAQHGDAFELTLNQSYRYEGHELPAGTTFKGQVVDANKSRTPLMPGYVELDFQQAVFPSGQVHDFSENTVNSKDVHNLDAVTVKKAFWSTLPFTLVSAADTVPLKYAANWSTWEIFPVSLGARIILGELLELTPHEKKRHQRHDQGIAYSMGHGALRGTGLTGLWALIHNGPEPELESSKSIPIRFDKDDFEQLFAAGVPVEGTVGDTNPDDEDRD